MLLRELLSESWSEKYKRSINCASPKGFSQKAHCQGRKKEEDQHPNDTPLGPETKPTMPAGTVRVDVDDVYDWYKLGQHISNMKGLGQHDFGKGPPSAIFSFGSEEEEHDYIKALKKTGLTTTDIDPVDPKQPKGMPRQKTDPAYNVDEAKKRKRKKIKRAAYGPGPYGWYGYDAGYGGEGGGDGGGESIENENFADGKNPQDKGDSKRHGINTKASVSSLRKTAKQGGRKGQLAHWLANMKAGRAKKNESLTEAVIHPNIMNALEDFLPLAMRLLKLNKLPKISIHKTIESGEQPSFGGYDPESNSIQLALKDRHPADILRTLAHELVHYKQNTAHKLHARSGMTGSPEENEANSKAGIIMRHFNKQFPQYLK